MSLLGSLFGGGSSQTTTTSNSEPWKAAQPALKLGLNQATKLFNADKNGSYFTGSTVVPWDQQTRKGMNFIQGGANANLAGKGLSGQYQDIINNGGMTGGQMQAQGNYQNVLAGNGLTPEQQAAMAGMGNTIANGGYNDAMRSAMAGMGKTIANNGYNDSTWESQESARNMLRGNGLSSAQQSALGGLQALASNPFNSYQQSSLKNTQNTANSKFDINSNPAFQDVLRQAQGAARDSVNMSAGGAGRYGGGVHQGNLASEVGDLTSRMVGNEYQNWQNRRDTANQNLFNMGQTGIGTQMSANQGAAGIGQQGIGNLQNAQNSVFNMGQGALGNLQAAQNAQFNMGQAGQDNRANAANSLASLGQTAFGNMGAAYTGMQQPANDLMKVGAMNEDLATRRMNDQLRLFNDKKNAPWEQIGRLNAIASGSGQMGGTQTQSAPGANPFLQALGYGATALGGLGSFI